LLHRLRAQVEQSADAELAALLAELESLPVQAGAQPTELPHPPTPAVVIPFRLRTDYGILSFFSTTTVFGTPVDITLSELAIESFFPADRSTAEALRRLAGASSA
jgi:hypothetical protein